MDLSIVIVSYNTCSLTLDCLQSVFEQTSGRVGVIHFKDCRLIQYLLRPVFVRVIKWLNKWWLKKTIPDWHLLTAKQMKELFPDAIIVREKVLGLTKSLIAVGGTGMECGWGPFNRNHTANN
jgi:hypothetical protein